MAEVRTHVQGQSSGSDWRGSGIGRALAQAGARLALSDIDQAVRAQTISQIKAVGQPGDAPLRVKGYRLDVAEKASVFAHAEEAIADFDTVHLLFNNAGTTLVGTVEHTSIEEFEWQLGINMWDPSVLANPAEAA